jgi:quercetin dioxygenase-like cupin family protein
MKEAKLSEFTKGWFIGDFEPSIYKTKDFEAAVKTYAKGDYEAAHYHKIAAEFTVIVSGEVQMNGIRYAAGDIIMLKPGEITDFLALTDAVCAVVKTPCVKDDKYTAGGSS